MPKGAVKKLISEQEIKKFSNPFAWIDYFPKEAKKDFTDMGYSISTEIEKPNRTPDQAADDIYNLVTTVTETGYFWEFGEKINW